MIQNKYTLVLWGFSPPDLARLIWEVIQLLKMTFPREQWFTDISPSEPVPLIKSDLETLISRKKESNEFNSLLLFLRSSNGMVVGFTFDAPKVVRKFDVVTLMFEKEHLLNENLSFDFSTLLALFEKLLKLFRPFWAAVHDTSQTMTEEYQERTKSLKKEEIPGSIHWVNFFGREMCNNLGGVPVLKAAFEEHNYKLVGEPWGFLGWLHEGLFDFNDKACKNAIDQVEHKLSLLSTQLKFKK